MRHFYRCGLHPDDVLTRADAFFPTIGLTRTAAGARSRTYDGELGTGTIAVRMEGGHYTFVEAKTSAQGESRLDRGVKNYFTRLHKLADPRHALSASY